MGRIRTVKPEFWLNEELAGVSPEACLLAIGLLNYSDDHGYFRAHPALIQAAVFPIRDLSNNIPILIQELSKIGYIEIFMGSDEKEYGHVIKFDSHQRVDKAKSSVIAELQTFDDDSKNDLGTILGGKEGKGREGNGKEGSQETPPPSKIEKKEKFGKEDFDSAVYIYETVLVKFPETRKPKLEQWADDIRKMREIDKVEPGRIAEVFLWAHNDSFWCKNIRSPGKLREKYETLCAQMQGNSDGRSFLLNGA